MLNEYKKHVLNEYLRNIHHISDKEYQKRAWIRGEPPGTDFEEAVCQFIDIGDPILENHRDFSIKDDQYQILKKFRDVFEAFADNNNSPSLFIETSEWAKIMDMAKSVLKVFNYK